MNDAIGSNFSLLPYSPIIFHAKNRSKMSVLSPFFTWRFFSHEQAKSECDWVVMSSVFVASQSSCFFLCSREHICLVENKL